MPSCRVWSPRIAVLASVSSLGLVLFLATAPWAADPVTRPARPAATIELALQADTKSKAAPKTVPGAKAPNPNTLIEPFTPPSLAELDAKAKWVDQPVLDSLKLLQDVQKKETAPSATEIQQTLALKNTSSAENAKIVRVLGRLATDEKQVNYNASINRAIRRDVKSTNPLLMSSTEEFDVSGLCSYGLFSFDWKMEPFAATDTVVSWQTSADRMYDKVILRTDCTWSDGKPITAHDVAFSFRTIMDPRIQIPAVRSGTDKLRWVEAYDDKTVVFFHKESLATNVWNINFPIIAKHIYEPTLAKDPTMVQSDEHVALDNKPVSGGPYIMAKRTRGQEIVLTRREDWYMQGGKQVRDKPYFKEIRFRVIEDPNTALLTMKKGDLDEQSLTPEQWQTQTGDAAFLKGNIKASGPEWVYFAFQWNNTSPFFSDKRVRQAMSYAFDHDEMLKTLCYNLYKPCCGIFPEGSWMAPKKYPAPYKQNQEKAEELLDQAGWKDSDEDGIRDKKINGKLVKFDFTILCGNSAERIAYCTLLKENLEQIGIECQVRPMEATVLQQKMLNKEFQAAFSGWGTGTDPDTSDNLWTTTGERNFISYSNAEVDKLYEDGRREFDKAKRAAIYARIHELVYADQPYTFLYFRNGFYAFNRNLRGINFSPRGPFHYGPGFSAIYELQH